MAKIKELTRLRADKCKLMNLEKDLVKLIHEYNIKERKEGNNHEYQN